MTHPQVVRGQAAVQQRWQIRIIRLLIGVLPVSPGTVIAGASKKSHRLIDTINDARLYDRLLGEFPEWIIKAREQRIL